MNYKVSIERIVSKSSDESYSRFEPIYEQQFENLDIAEVIKAANQFNKTT